MTEWVDSRLKLLIGKRRSQAILFFENFGSSQRVQTNKTLNATKSDDSLLGVGVPSWALFQVSDM